MSQLKSQKERSKRYRKIIKRISSLDAFDMNAAKSQCDDKPFFIARIVRELVDDGWLIRDAAHEEYHRNDGRGRFNARTWIEQKVNGVQVTATPEQDRPRERLIESGAESLTNSQLLAILIRSGRPGEASCGTSKRTERNQRLGFQSCLLPNHGRHRTRSPDCCRIGNESIS